jgi:hypothetical protein
MQAYTHFLTSVLLAKIVFHFTPTWPFWLQVVVICIVAFFSHVLIDGFVFITYHPKEALPQDKFWVGYHAVALIISIIIPIIFWSGYWWAMFFGILIDILDWGIIRPILKKPYIMHIPIEWIRTHWLGWIPDMTEHRWTVINEIVIIGLLLWGIVSF